MPEPIRVLLVDDDEDDYVLTRGLLAEIGAGRFALEWANTFDTGLAAMGRHDHQVYLLDYRLGEHDGLELLQAAVNDGCRAPVILLTGQGDRELDLAAMEQGAADYLVKGEITSAMLERSIRYAMEHRRLVEELLAALVQIKTLRGIISICSYCHRIFNDEQTWQRLEAYLEEHSDARLSHGVCPECISTRVQKEIEEFRSRQTSGE